MARFGVRPVFEQQYSNTISYRMETLLNDEITTGIQKKNWNLVSGNFKKYLKEKAEIYADCRVES